MATFCTAQDLRNTLTPQTFLQIFDDNNVGTVLDTDPVVQTLLLRAHTQVMSYMKDTYGTLVMDSTTSPIPQLLWSAELDYAVGYAMERRPDYMRTFGEEARADLWKRAQATMDRVRESVQQIVDAAPSAKPTNTGAVVYNTAPRVTVDSLDGTYNGGDY